VFAAASSYGKLPEKWGSLIEQFAQKSIGSRSDSPKFYDCIAWCESKIKPVNKKAPFPGLFQMLEIL
jgi:hypothetical protein